MYLYKHFNETTVINLTSVDYVDIEDLEKINKLLKRNEFETYAMIYKDDIYAKPELQQYINETKIYALKTGAIQFILVLIDD